MPSAQPPHCRKGNIHPASPRQEHAATCPPSCTSQIVLRVPESRLSSLTPILGHLLVLRRRRLMLGASNQKGGKEAGRPSVRIRMYYFVERSNVACLVILHSLAWTQ